MRADAGWVSLGGGAGVPERLGWHLVRAVRVIGTVGRAEAGRVTGLGVRSRLVLVVLVVAVLARFVTGRMVMLVRGAVLAVVAAVGAVVVVAHCCRAARMSVRGQQRVVAVRIVGAQSRV